MPPSGLEGVDQERWEDVLHEIFNLLDKKNRGFLSRVELAHIMDAMQADPNTEFDVPEPLKLGTTMKDSRVTLADLQAYLRELTLADLEDLKWFAESVVKVESELREVWQSAVQRWQEKVERLYHRDLHRYVLSSQPERVSRWLLLRTSTGTSGSGGDVEGTSTGLLGLGISQQEVEVLFTNEAADDINRCSERIEPFLVCLEIRDQLGTMIDETTALPVYPELENRVVDAINQLNEHAAQSREFSCLLIHQDTLSFVTALIRSKAFSQAVCTEASSLTLTLVNWRVQDDTLVEYEAYCRKVLQDFLELGFDPANFQLGQELPLLQEMASEGQVLPRQLIQARSYTVADWVGSLLMLSSDFDRGEMLDMLSKYDEKRISLVDEGGQRQHEQDAIAPSLLSFGKVIPYALCRLDVSSHHSLHEHRTPLRTHMLKLLLNVLTGAGERGRRLFRAGEGMRVLCILIRGNSWGLEREEISEEEELDRDEEDQLYRTRQWIWQDPYQSWPYVESEESARSQRYYNMDFLDDKFYGSKDRVLASAFLEYLAEESMWGPEGLVEEMTQYRFVLQVTCRVRPPLCSLARLLLTTASFPEYLRRAATEIAEIYASKALGPVTAPDGSCHSIFPITYDAEEASGSAESSGRSARRAFMEEIVKVEAQNVVVRILSHAYHNLQQCLQEERAMREDKNGAADPALGGDDKKSDEATQLEEEITECCRLLARQMPVEGGALSDVCVAVYTQIKEFTGKALLAVNQLPPVNPDERQKARSLEVAKTVPPRPMYFGHYQQLIFNQSNPTQPSSRDMVSDYQAQLKCLQGAADILFTGENRYLSEPSLFPYEFLIVLRMLQMIRLRDGQSVPPFVGELQDLLEQLTGQRSSFIFSDAQDDIELAGADYPWRTGLAPLNTFRISQVPLRRSQLRSFARRSPLEVTRGLSRILKEYTELPLWEDENDENPAKSTDKVTLDAAAKRRSVLLALVFNHLAYYHPKSVTIEDSSNGLSLRLGLTLEFLEEVARLLEEAGLDKPKTKAEIVARWDDLPEGCRVITGSPSNSVVIFFVRASPDGKEVAFILMQDFCMLWANCCKDNAQVLTGECGFASKYFEFAKEEQTTN